MPFIHFINSDEEVVKKFAEEKLEEFSILSGATLENIYIINQNSKIINQQSSSYIKIDWMPRDAKVEEAVVEFLKKFLCTQGYEKSAVYFNEIDRSHYHLGKLL